MFFTLDEKPLHLENTYKNQSCFLILSGPSLNNLDLKKLNQPGLITFGLNNSPKKFRPDLWTLVDDVDNFMISIWKDPKIRKFVPHPKNTHRLFDNTIWKESHLTAGDCPNVVYYKRNELFNAETFLTEDTINWGCSKENGGCRSVMLAAIRIIHLLGFNKVFLLGCNFKMDDQNKYAFAQDRTQGSMSSNNRAYRILNTRFDLLRPVFEKVGFYIFNCTPDSGLKSFDYLSYNTAIKIALKDFPDTETERSEGMYDRKAKLREEQRKKTQGVIYYNFGLSYLVRLAVSISSLRKSYDGMTTILCDKSSIEECKKIADYFKIDVKEVDFSAENRNGRLFNKTLLHKYTPYQATAFLDADTLIIKDFHRLLDEAEENEFTAVQFADWTPKTSVIEKRIREWRDIVSVDKALEYPKAINTGVFAFKKDSTLMKNWYELAVKGEKFFIPDEISCQILLTEYNHSVMDSTYNTSCKYGSIGRRTKIIHFHGNKHCRKENGQYLFHSDLWYKEFDSIKKLDFVKNNIQYDNKLMENI
jgi:hypothetical protein